MKLSATPITGCAVSASGVQDQLSLGDWHLLAGLRRDDFTVTSRRNDLDKGRDPLGHQPESAPGPGGKEPHPRSSLYTSYSKTFTPVGGGAYRHHPGTRTTTLDPQHTRLWPRGREERLAGRPPRHHPLPLPAGDVQQAQRIRWIPPG